MRARCHHAPEGHPQGVGWCGVVKLHSKVRAGAQRSRASRATGPRFLIAPRLSETGLNRLGCLGVRQVDLPSA